MKAQYHYPIPQPNSYSKPKRYCPISKNVTYHWQRLGVIIIQHRHFSRSPFFFMLLNSWN